MQYSQWYFIFNCFNKNDVIKVCLIKCIRHPRVPSVERLKTFQVQSECSKRPTRTSTNKSFTKSKRSDWNRKSNRWHMRTLCWRWDWPTPTIPCRNSRVSSRATGTAAESPATTTPIESPPPSPQRDTQCKGISLKAPKSKNCDAKTEICATNTKCKLVNWNKKIGGFLVNCSKFRAK